MPPTLNPSIYSKRKPFELSPFLFHEHALSLFCRSLVFFISIHSTNSMFLDLYSHTHTSLLPASLSSLFHFNRGFQGYRTRSRFNLHKMSVRYQFAISSQAPIIWNDIPLTVFDSLTTTNFKKKLKLHVLSLN